MKELQREIILQELLSGDSITPGDAWRHHKIERLADIIFKLRNQGYVILDHTNGKPCSDYYIEKNSKYAIQDMVTGDLLHSVNLGNETFTWCDGDDYELALYLRSKLYDIVNYLQKELKMKVCVVEQKEAE